MVFVKSWWGIITNAYKMRCEKLWLQKELIGWVFPLPSSFALVPKLVNK